MSFPKRTLMAIGITAAIGLGSVSTLAVAQWQNSPLMRGFTDAWSSGASTPNVVGELKSNEGIYVDMKDFKIAKGMAKDDASVQAQIVKLGAKEVKDGAIIFRAGEKLYLVDRHPSAATQ